MSTPPGKLAQPGRLVAAKLKWTIRVALLRKLPLTN